MTLAPTESDAELASVARRSLANLVGAAVSAVTNFGLVFVVARLASSHAAGVFFAVTSGFLVLETIGKLGADVSVVYFLARWRAVGSTAQLRVGLRVACAPAVVTSSAIALAVIVFAHPLARLVGDAQGSAVAAVRVLALVLPIAAAYDIIVAATRGMDQMGPTVVIEKIARPSAQFLLVMAVLAAGWTAAMSYAWALPYLAALVAAGIVMHRVARRNHMTLSASRVPRGTAREFWRFSVPRAVAGVAQILLQRLDIVLVAAMRGATAAAVYTAATRFLVVGQFINQAINTPLQPRLSAALALGDTGRARSLYRATTAWIVLATWPLFGTAIVLSGWYVRAFGASYANGVPVVVVLSVAMLVASATGPADNVILMAGKSSWNLLTTLAALVVNVGLDVALIPHYGLIGAAIGWCGGILASNVVPLVVVRWTWRLDPYGTATVRACVLCAVCFLIAPALGRLVLDDDRGTVIGLAVGLVAYVGGVYRSRRVFDLGSLHLSRRGHRAAHR